MLTMAVVVVVVSNVEVVWFEWMRRTTLARFMCVAYSGLVLSLSPYDGMLG